MKLNGESGLRTKGVRLALLLNDRSAPDAVDGSHPTASQCAKVVVSMNHKETRWGKQPFHPISGKFPVGFIRKPAIAVPAAMIS